MIKDDFPIFDNSSLVYLDNGATTHKPNMVIDAISYYYKNINSNIGRGVYKLAEKSTDAYEQTRIKMAKFINSPSKNIVYTAGTTMSLNLVANIIKQHIKPKGKIVLSVLEHHANILPWQRLAKELDLEIIYLSDNNILANPFLLEDSFWKDVKILSLTHTSNVTGQILPIKEWCYTAKKHNVITVIDGAQGISSEIVNVQDIECDFYAFSAHKLYAPMGVGILYIANKFLDSEPFILGGGIIEDVVEKDYFLLEGNHRFEAGTPNVADIYACSTALDYLESQNWSSLILHMKKLEMNLYDKLKSDSRIQILNDESRTYFKHSHIISFNLKNIHAHDVGTFFSEENIAVRVGKHCTHPLHQFLKVNSSVRASFGIYNTEEDINKLIDTINRCFKFFGV